MIMNLKIYKLKIVTEALVLEIMSQLVDRTNIWNNLGTILETNVERIKSVFKLIKSSEINGTL